MLITKTNNNEKGDKIISAWKYASFQLHNFWIRATQRAIADILEIISNVSPETIVVEILILARKQRVTLPRNIDFTGNLEALEDIAFKMNFTVCSKNFGAKNCNSC